MLLGIQNDLKSFPFNQNSPETAFKSAQQIEQKLNMVSEKKPIHIPKPVKLLHVPEYDANQACKISTLPGCEEIRLASSPDLQRKIVHGQDFQATLNSQHVGRL